MGGYATSARQRRSTVAGMHGALPAASGARAGPPRRRQTSVWLLRRRGRAVVNLQRARGGPSRWRWAHARVPPGGDEPARGYYDGGACGGGSTTSVRGPPRTRRIHNERAGAPSGGGSMAMAAGARWETLSAASCARAGPSRWRQTSVWLLR